MRQTLQRLWLLILFISLSHHFLKAQVCLDFDGSNDYISLNTPFQNGDFTIEMWFRSRSTPADANFRYLFSLRQSGIRFEVGIQGGQMQVICRLPSSPSTVPTPISGNNYATNSWHHIAIVRSGNTIEFYIDCVLEYTKTISSPLRFRNIRLGHRFGGATPNNDWLGQIDNFRIWKVAKTLTEIENIKNCGLGCDERDLFLSWGFEEGIPNGDNTARAGVEDCSPNGHDVTFSQDASGLFGFALTGTTSNYVSSTAPIFNPSQTFNNLTLEIKDYPYQNNLQTEICSGDPVHFRLLQNGISPAAASNVTVDWFYRDGTNTPTQLPSNPFSGFAFAVPQGELQYACDASTTGYVDRTFYAVTSVSDPINGWTCKYKSDEYDLRICCPIPNLTVDVTPDLFCEGETQTVTVSIPNPPPLIQIPGQYMNIEWYFNGNYIGFTDQTSFTYTVAAPTVSNPTQLCFEAKITNCAGKQESFQRCISIDPEPTCGKIIGWPQPNPQNMTLVSTAPHLTYEYAQGRMRR